MGVGIRIGTEVAFPSRYLGADDLGGKDFTLEIESIRRDEVELQDGKKERKTLVRFKGAKKEWILNATNAKTIKAIYGPEPGAPDQDVTKIWPGKKVTLYPTTTRAFGEVKECVRVRKLKVS